MKRPATIKELVWKYMSASQIEKDLFGGDSVVPASDLVDALTVAERSMKINCDMGEQCGLMLKFLIDNQSRLESQDFRLLIVQTKLSLDKLNREAELLKNRYGGEMR
jgi:hypothetical protein